MNLQSAKAIHPEAFEAGRAAALEHYAAVDAGTRLEHGSERPRNPHPRSDDVNVQGCEYFAWNLGWNLGIPVEDMRGIRRARADRRAEVTS